MDPLAKPLRKQLEDAVVAARDTAEKAARAALMHLGVGDADLPKHLTDQERALRRRLPAVTQLFTEPSWSPSCSTTASAPGGPPDG